MSILRYYKKVINLHPEDQFSVYSTHTRNHDATTPQQDVADCTLGNINPVATKPKIRSEQVKPKLDIGWIIVATTGAATGRMRQIYTRVATGRYARVRT